VEKQENETDVVCSSKSLTEFEDQEELQESANSTAEGLEHLSKRRLRKLKKHETWLARLPEKRYEMYWMVHLEKLRENWMHVNETKN
jgi:hypothetical protein